MDKSTLNTVCGVFSLLIKVALAICAIVVSGVAWAQEEFNQPLCQGEADAFEMFIRAAQKVGKPDYNYKPPSDLQFVEHMTRDGVLLRGFRANARNPEGKAVKPQGYILFIQGNAMFSDHVVGFIKDLARGGFDVYVYDYRGYGRSEGNPSIRAIISDYRELIGKLNEATTKSGGRYKKRFVYAISAGGAVFLNAISDDMQVDRIVLDSVPERLDRKITLLWIFTLFNLQCPSNIHPVNRLPERMSNFLMIQGENDRQVRWNKAQKLMFEEAERRGAKIMVMSDAGHALSDSEEATKERINALLNFFDFDSEQ